MLDGVSQLGILMLLLLTGMETDSACPPCRLRRVSVWSRDQLPFARFALGKSCRGLLPHPDTVWDVAVPRHGLSISSVKIVAMVVRGCTHAPRPARSSFSAVIDDTIGWIIIITFSLARHGAVDLPALAQSVLGTAAFLAFSFTIGRRIVATRSAGPTITW
jgi:Kef-type K+ transport system membrane component KefB